MIIGISGKKGVGKNEVADLIQHNSIREWRGKQFADKLKEMVAVLLGCHHLHMENQDIKEEPVDWLPTNPRYLLQSLGTDWGRKLIHEDIWVRALLSQYTPMHDWIITDVRFINEVNAVKERGGLVIRINRYTGSEDTHPSETALDNYDEWDYTIDNNGTLKDLQAKVEKMCKDLGI